MAVSSTAKFPSYVTSKVFFKSGMKNILVQLDTEKEEDNKKMEVHKGVENVNRS
jgi:hypothetical protein